jgi:hypothetical protein
MAYSDELEDKALEHKNDLDQQVEGFLTKARRSSNLDSTDRLGFLNLLNFFFSVGSFLLLLILVYLYFGVANKPLPSLVQTADGKTIRVLAQDSNERSPSVIVNTTTVALTKLFTWRSFLAPANSQDVISPKLDPGIDIPSKGQNTGGKIPTSVYEASFVLASDFQEPFLSYLASLVKDAGVFSSGAQVSLEILSISDNPISIGAGLWRVDLVGTLVRVLPNKTITRAKLNKQVFLKAVPASIISDRGSSAENMLSRLVAEGSATGVRIYAMKDVDEKNLNLYPNPNQPSSNPSPSNAPSTPTTTNP